MPTAAYRRQPQPRRRLYAGPPSGASAAFPASPGSGAWITFIDF